MVAGTIGPGWAEDPVERARQVAEQEAIVSAMAGLYVGMLDEDELEAFDEACRSGAAHRRYRGAAGLMDLAVVEPGPAPDRPLAGIVWC